MSETDGCLKMPNNFEHTLQTLFDYQHIAQNENLERVAAKAEMVGKVTCLSLEDLQQVAGGANSMEYDSGQQPTMSGTNDAGGGTGFNIPGNTNNPFSIHPYY